MTNSNKPSRHFWLAGRRDPAQDLFFREALDPALWQPGDERQWDTCWYTGMPAPAVFEELTADKSINHIPGNNALTVKSNLYATLLETRERIWKQYGETSDEAQRLDFFPRTYVLPDDYHALQETALDNPGKRWILKPKNAARGKGIEVVRDIATVPLGNTWMVQDYLDRPHTINGHKYVLRLYVLIRSVDPLRVYLYEEGSAKLASAPYDMDDLGNPYAHLTNPDLNANNQDASSPVVFLSHERYRAWLREQGHDDQALFARIRDMVILTAISSREKMLARTRAVNADTSGCYELLGLDCLVDADLKPWLLECNLSPSLDICAAPADGGVEEEHTKRQLVADAVRMLDINGPASRRVNVRGAERIVAEADTELQRAGGYERVYPAQDVARYLPYFPLPRLADMVLADDAAGSPVARPRVAPLDTAEVIGDNRLSLYAERTGTLYAPNPTAAWIWLKATEGTDPDTIADELLVAQEAQGGSPDDAWQTRREIWNILADWASSGMLLQQSDTHVTDGDTWSVRPLPEADTHRATDRPEAIGIRLGTRTLRLRFSARTVAIRLRPIFTPMETANARGNHFDVLQSTAGYAIASEGRLLTDGLTLAGTGPALCRLLQARSIQDERECAIAGMLVPLADPTTRTDTPVPAVFLPHHAAGGWDLLGLRLASRFGFGYAGGIRVRLDGADNAAQALGLPARIAEVDAGQDRVPSDIEHVVRRCEYLHTWPTGERGILVPASHEALGPGYRITAIIMPMLNTKSTTGHGNGSGSGLSEHDALAAVLPGAIGATGQRLSAGEVTRLATWLGRYRIQSMNPLDALTGIDVSDDGTSALPSSGSAAAGS